MIDIEGAQRTEVLVDYEIRAGLEHGRQIRLVDLHRAQHPLESSEIARVGDARGRVKIA
jgi:hypothetical protein